MTDEELREPISKSSARFHSLKSPLPVPIRSVTFKEPRNDVWCVYNGELESHYVRATAPGFLHSNGFFGKEIFLTSQSATGNQDVTMESTIPKIEKSQSVENSRKRKLSQGKYKRKQAKKDNLMYLHLTFEEAFFLAFGLGCLTIKDKKDLSLSLCEMWQQFQSREVDFVKMFVAYHHFRSKGWVVRFTNTYGSDMLLYKKGMPFYHASYSVFVLSTERDSLNSLDAKPRMTWKDLSCISRVNERVAKDTVFCHVLQPGDLKSPDEIKGSVNVAKTVLRRWLPQRHRLAKS